MVEDGYLDLKATLSSLPPVRAIDTRAQIETELHDSHSKIPILVALDDDPTGTQTCHDVHVLTVWDTATLVQEFQFLSSGQARYPGFFILTNSRALHPPEAEKLMQKICSNLATAASQTGLSFEIVLRGDSTLRGHFPLEPEAAESILGETDAWILCPFFLQGGRYTINDVHYVAEGKKLIPAAQTPFAKDATFGYQSSNLRDWVVEKSKGTIASERVKSLSLDTIRKGGPGEVLDQLSSYPRRSVVIINASATEDVDVVILALLAAAQKGRKFLFRTGAAFVSCRLAIPQIPPISAEELALSSSAGGLIIAGSYVPKTTSQLEALRRMAGDRLTTVELDVKQLLDLDQSEAAIEHAIAIAEKEISRNQDVLVMTGRELVTGKNEMESLNIGSIVARALVSFLVNLSARPRYIIAKGGITSSDMATKGLRMRRALIVGQAAPGVPLWRCDESQSKWAGLPFVVFPGNVGGVEALGEVVERWRV